MARLLASALTATCLALLLGMPVKGLPETNIGLRRFEAFPSESGVRLEWEVETEVGTAGYKIKRGENGTLAYLANPEGSGDLFVVAKGGPALSASYSVMDETAVNGSTYVYQLVEVTTSSSEVFQEELSVEVVAPTDTPTPVSFSGGGNSGGTGGGSGNSSTATATIAAAPTTSVTTGPTPTPLPTRAAPTPLPTATTQPALAAEPTAAPPAAGEIVNDSASPAQSEVTVEAEAESFVLDGVVAAAEAQEEQASAADSYPGSLSPDEQATTIQTADEPVNIEPAQAAGAASENPVVIGVGASSGGALTSEPIEETSVTQEPNSGGSGRLLLWVAFIVAMIIFVAAVIGAILLYNRRRTTK